MDSSAEPNSSSNISQNTDTNSESLSNLNQNISTSQVISINKWNTQHILEWLSRKLPVVYENYKDNFIQNEITGENLLANNFNQACLDQLKIFDRNLRDQLLCEISMLKIRNEYELLKRFKSMNICINKI